MFEIVEKKSFKIDSCLVNKKLIQKIGEIVGQLKTIYLFKSDSKDVKSDKIEQILGLDWPQNIREIRVEFSGPLGNAVIDLKCGRGRKSYGHTLVTGSDPTWVEGVSSQLKNVFKSARVWYWCIAQYWQIRAVLSGMLLALLIWRLNHSLWLITSQYVSMPEISFFLLIFAVWFGIGVYPLERFWLWIFPRYEFEQTSRQRIRRYLGAILSLILAWVVTDILLPSLLL